MRGLVKDLIPGKHNNIFQISPDLLTYFLTEDFFWYSSLDAKRDPMVQLEVVEAVGTSSLVIHCGLINFNMPLGTSYNNLNESVSSAVPETIHAFQQTFPDRYGFRVRLISEALRYEATNPEKVETVPELIL